MSSVGPSNCSMGSTPGLNKSSVHRILLAQSVATLIASASFLFFDWAIACSILLGGMVVVIPNWLMARYWMKRTATLGQILLAESGKLGMSALIFSLIFIGFKPLDIRFLFGTYGVLLLFFILIPLLTHRRSVIKQ